MTALCLLPPDVALALSPARVRLLRRRYEGLGGFDENDPIAIARAISFRELPERTTELLHSAVYLATEDGREAIYEAARGRRDLAPWLSLTAVDLAFDVARAADAGDAAARAVLARARTRMGRFLATRVEYDLFARRRERPARLESLVECARDVHGDRLVDAWVVDCKDGVLRAVAVHEGLRAAIVTRARSGEVPRAVRRSPRPLGCDTIRWDAARGRVGLTLARASRLPEWREKLGVHGAGDAELLERRPSYTLKGPHGRGGAWFTKARLPRGAKLVEVVACEVDDGVRFGARGENALGAIQSRVGMGGYMYRSTLRYLVARGHADATIELPNKLIVADPRFDALVREGLDVAELTAPGTIPDDVPSLEPWEQPEWRWVEVVGREGYDWAVSEKILVPVRSNRPADESFRAHGSMFTAHEIDGEEVVYCCPPDFSVRARDEAHAVLQRMRLDRTRLAEVLRERAELDAPSQARVGDVPDGVVAIGELWTRSKTAAIAIFLVLGAVRREDAAAFGKKLRDACLKGQHAVALVAKGRTLEGAVAVVPLEGAEMLGHGDVRRAAALAADAVKLGGEIDPWRWATRDRPCVLVRETREIHLGKARLDVTENQRTMLFALAEEDGAHVSPQALGKRISAHASLPDQVVRKAMLDLEVRVRRSVKESGAEVPEAWIRDLVVEQRGKGYRIGVGVVVR